MAREPGRRTDPNADRIVPEWQHLEPGDLVRGDPERIAWEVVEVRPNQALVLRGAVSGSGEGNAQEMPFEFVWAFVLDDRADGTSRLLVRERWANDGSPGGRVMAEVVSLMSFVTSVGMLRGVRHRAETVRG